MNPDQVANCYRACLYYPQCPSTIGMEHAHPSAPKPKKAIDTYFKTKMEEPVQ